ncbi:MAG TPA: hypothetical protein VI914_03165 [Thermodesulfobacteriota bacterium]|nr:hypothetical protein [Thermodesulfobacteriota bacterium]
MMYNKFNMLLRKSGILVAIVLIVTGCTGEVVRYINPEANFSYIKKVAVLPFNNLSDDRFAGEKVRSAITVDLLSRGIFDVVEQGEVNKIASLVLRAAGAEEGMVTELDRETLKLLGERLGVQAVVLGSVDEYVGRREEGLVAISVRMLDTSSGIILWQAKASTSSASLWRKILGLEGLDTGTLTRRVVKTAFDTLL